MPKNSVGKCVVLALTLACFFWQTLHAQQLPSLTPEQIRAEIVRRGYDPVVVEEKLRARGFDPYKIAPEQVPAVQTALMEILREMETAPPPASPAATPASAVQQPETRAPLTQLAVQAPDPVRPDVPDKKAPVFGQQLFRDGKLEIFRQTSDVTVPNDYLIGPGDKLVVSVWGQVSNYTEPLTVNAEGFVQPASLPRVFLGGFTFEKAKKQLEAVYARRYPVNRSNFEVGLSMSRTVDVNITGEVFNYGVFKLSALNTAIQALVACGGPTDLGSVRNITIYRSGQAPRRLDVYQYLLDPSLSRNFYLDHNDNIFVPIAERVVEVQGAVKRPHRYELLRDENLLQLIRWAGGLTDDAYTENVQIVRIENQVRKIMDINLRQLMAENRDFPLLDGDVVSIRNVNADLNNFVLTEGAVEYSGRFAFVPGMKLAELAARARLKPEARTDFAYLQRTLTDGSTQNLVVNLREASGTPAGPANIALQAKDKLVVFDQSRFVDNATLESEGAVRDPRQYPFDRGRPMRVSELVELSGGLKPDAADVAYIIRTFPDNPKEKNYIRINIRQALSEPASAQNQQLEPFDRLLVMSKATFKDVYTVMVKGAVRNPGEYQYDASLRMQDVITLAGGLRMEAASNRVDVFRVVISQNQPTTVTVGTFEIDNQFNVVNAGTFQLQPFDIVIVRNVPEFELQKMVSINGEVRYPGDYALIDKNERLLSVLERAGGLSPEAFPEGATLYRNQDRVGYIVMRLDEVLKNPADRHNFILKAGDVIEIPKARDIVSIKGATKAFDLYPDKIIGNGGGINVAYKEGKRARYYIKEYAAGFSKQASRRSVTVEHANGEIKRTVNLGLFKIYPKVKKGSIINVGKKPQEEPRPVVEKKPVDWNAVLADTVSKATSVLTILVLLSRL